jgi:glutamate racemase
MAVTFQPCSTPHRSTSNRRHVFSALFIVWSLAVTGLSLPTSEPMDGAVTHALAHPRGEAVASFVAGDYMGDLRGLPIGVFDSGIGGLTVLEAILQLDAFHNDTLQPGADGLPDFKGERFLYFGDQANMPYGNYPTVGKTTFLRELILRDLLFLLGRRRHDNPGLPVKMDKPAVKAVVIACNTATAYGLGDIRTALAAWKIPLLVVGVVEAGSRGVVQVRAKNVPDGSIAVMATVGTCTSGVYPRTIQQELGRAGYRSAKVFQYGSASLAGVIEGDPAFPQSVAECTRNDIRALLETASAASIPAPIRIITLGCTHYPLAQREIEAAFLYWHDWRDDSGRRPFRELAAGPRIYINPAEWTARELFRELAHNRLRCPSDKSTPLLPNLFFLSVANPTAPGIRLSTDGGFDPDYKYGRLDGQWNREDTLNVPLTPSRLPSASRKLVEGKLPAVWNSLCAADSSPVSRKLR